MKNELDIHTMTAAEAGELVNDITEGQEDTEESNRLQEDLVAKLSDYEVKDDIDDLFCQMIADSNNREQIEEYEGVDDFDLTD